jgi:hypothetical protein
LIFFFFDSSHNNTVRAQGGFPDILVEEDFSHKHAPE